MSLFPIAVQIFDKSDGLGNTAKNTDRRNDIRRQTPCWCQHINQPPGYTCSVSHKSACLPCHLVHIYPSCSQGYHGVLEKCLLNSNYTMSETLPWRIVYTEHRLGVEKSVFQAQFSLAPEMNSPRVLQVSAPLLYKDHQDKSKASAQFK